MSVIVVMTTAVKARPSRVPATPKREVRRAARGAAILTGSRIGCLPCFFTRNPLLPLPQRHVSTSDTYTHPRGLLHAVTQYIVGYSRLYAANGSFQALSLATIENPTI